MAASAAITSPHLRPNASVSLIKFPARIGLNDIRRLDQRQVLINLESGRGIVELILPGLHRDSIVLVASL